MKITVVSDNTAQDGFAAEHGLALLLEKKNRPILFDTGAGGALMPNLKRLGFPPERIRCVVLSHGHFDHTGGLADLLNAAPGAQLCFCAGITQSRYSLHPGKPVKALTMPENACAAFREQKIKMEISHFHPLGDGIYSTGPIPRRSGEDCGGPFFLDPEGRNPDRIPEEQALLLEEGILIQGCCHSGIINTLEHCRKHCPEHPVHTVIGGLHLLHADQGRLEQTAEYLREQRLKRLILLHCTGERAVEYFRANLPDCEITTGKAGDRYDE